jgi:heterodisulfide reductase subunit A
MGGGISGITVAINLALRGVAVTLIEREAALGGNARTVCCKAINGVCQLCGGCLLRDRIALVQALPGVQVVTGATVSRVRGPGAGAQQAGAQQAAPLQVVLDSGVELSAQAVVLATGFDHVDARTKGPYGYGILPAVTTGEEMERRLSAEGQWAYDGKGIKRVAFIQCVGSRDEQAGRGYCSQVCCRYALRLARLLKQRIPDVQITVHKMDLQTSGRDICPTWDAARKEGLRVIAGLPAVIRRAQDNPNALGNPAAPGSPAPVTFLYDDILAAKVAQETYDLVVLATGIQPRADAAQVADLFAVERDRYGFFATRADETTTLTPGVFVAGCCAAPRSMAESVAHANQAAEACYAYLYAGAQAAVASTLAVEPSHLQESQP